MSSARAPSATWRSRLTTAADIATGFALVRALGAYDIGQSVIVAGGIIEAIEGAEGTDRMLERTAAARKSRPGCGAAS